MAWEETILCIQVMIFSMFCRIIASLALEIVNIYALEIRGSHREVEKAASVGLSKHSPSKGWSQWLGRGREQDWRNSNIPSFPALQQTSEIGYSSKYEEWTQSSRLQPQFGEGEGFEGRAVVAPWRGLRWGQKGLFCGYMNYVVIIWSEGCLFVRSQVRPKGHCRIRQSIEDQVENL